MAKEKKFITCDGNEAAAHVSYISLDTLKTTTSELIATIKEVERIHADGAHQREIIEKELHSMAIQLQDAITSSGK